MRNQLPFLLAAVAAAFLFQRSLHAANANPFEKEITAFEASDKTNPPPKGAILFVGSSSIRLWPNLPADFPGLTVIQRGFGGSKMPDATYFADRIVIPYRPSKIVIYEGDNDIAAGSSPQKVADDFKTFVKKVHSSLPDSKIYFLAVKPSPSRWFLSPQTLEANHLIRQYCRSHRNLAYIDTWTPILGSNGQPDPSLFKSDNLHMNEKGYARWVPVIKKALKD